MIVYHSQFDIVNYTVTQDRRSSELIKPKGLWISLKKQTDSKFKMGYCSIDELSKYI
jgi:hypothetical protein